MLIRADRTDRQDGPTDTGRAGAAPGRLRAAQDVGDVLPAAVGERVDASPELPRDLEGRRAQTTVSAPSGLGLQDRHARLNHLLSAASGSASHLLVGGSASGHQNNVETSESSHWDEEQAGHAHDSQSEELQSRGRLQQKQKQN